TSATSPRGWEASDPREVVRDLNAYFTEMETAIRAHGGLVLQYIGDEIEAVFGAPMDKPNHAEAAVRAALDMRARLAVWNAARQRAGRRPLRNGIGVHTGTVLAGNIGSADRLAYALVGDPVNLASRPQNLTTAPRALAVQTRTLEFYGQLGLATTVVEHGLRLVVANFWVRAPRSHAPSSATEAWGSARSPMPWSSRRTSTSAC